MKNVDKLQAILRQKAGYVGSTEDLNNYLSTKGNADKVVSILNKTAGYTGSVDDFKNYMGISDTVETEEQPQQETKISAVGVPDLVSATDKVENTQTASTPLVSTSTTDRSTLSPLASNIPTPNPKVDWAAQEEGSITKPIAGELEREQPVNFVGMTPDPKNDPDYSVTNQDGRFVYTFDKEKSDRRKENDAFLTILDEQKKELSRLFKKTTESVKKYNEENPTSGWDNYVPAYSGAIFAKHEIEKQKDKGGKGQGDIWAAEAILKDAEQTFKAPKKGENWAKSFGKGGAETVTDPDAWLFGILSLNEVAQSLPIFEKVEKGEPLTDTESALMDAMLTRTQAEAMRSGDTSNWYKGGKIAGEALPFMRDMAMTGGLGTITTAGGKGTVALAKRATAKYLRKKAEKQLLKEGVEITEDILSRRAADLFMRTAKVADYTGRVLTSATVTPAVRTPLMATSYSGVAKNMQPKVVGDEFGTYQIQEGDDLGTAVGKQFVEVQSEGIGEFFAPALKGIKLLGGKAIPKVISDSKFGQVGSKVVDAIMLDNPYLQKAGVSGIAGETGEEIFGQTEQYILGFTTKEDLDNFYSGDNFKSMLIGFAPMSALGIAGNALNYSSNEIKYRRAKKGLGGIADELDNSSIDELDNKMLEVLIRNNAFDGKGNLTKQGRELHQNMLSYVQRKMAKAIADNVSDKSTLNEQVNTSTDGTELPSSSEIKTGNTGLPSSSESTRTDLTQSKPTEESNEASDALGSNQENDIEAKKADIESRRRRTTIDTDGSLHGFESEGIWHFDYMAPDGYRTQYRGTDKQKVLDAINAKYDAELKALEKSLEDSNEASGAVDSSQENEVEAQQPVEPQQQQQPIEPQQQQQPVEVQQEQQPVEAKKYEDSKRGVVTVEGKDGNPVELKIRSEEGFEFNEDGSINLEETARKHVAAAFDADGEMIPLNLLAPRFSSMKIISAITLEQKNAQDKQAEEQLKAQEEAMRSAQAAQEEQAQAIQAEEAKKQEIAAQVEEAPLGNNEKAFAFKSEDGTYTFGEARTDNGVSSFKTEGKAIDVVNKAKKQNWSKGFDFEVVPVQIGTTGTGQFQQPVYEYSVVAKQKQIEESTESDAQESNTAYWNDKPVKVMGEVKEGERTYMQVQLDNGETKRVSKESLFDSEKQPLYPREQKAEQVKEEKPIDHLKNINKASIDIEGLANQLRYDYGDEVSVEVITDSFNESFDKIKSAKNGIARGQAKIENENWRKVGLLFGLNLVNPIESAEVKAVEASPIAAEVKPVEAKPIVEEVKAEEVKPVVEEVKAKEVSTPMAEPIQEPVAAVEEVKPEKVAEVKEEVKEPAKETPIKEEPAPVKEQTVEEMIAEFRELSDKSEKLNSKLKKGREEASRLESDYKSIDPNTNLSDWMSAKKRYNSKVSEVRENEAQLNAMRARKDELNNNIDKAKAESKKNAEKLSVIEPAIAKDFQSDKNKKLELYELAEFINKRRSQLSEEVIQKRIAEYNELASELGLPNFDEKVYTREDYKNEYETKSERKPFTDFAASSKKEGAGYNLTALEDALDSGDTSDLVVVKRDDSNRVKSVANTRKYLVLNREDEIPSGYLPMEEKFQVAYLADEAVGIFHKNEKGDILFIKDDGTLLNKTEFSQYKDGEGNILKENKKQKHYSDTFGDKPISEAFDEPRVQVVDINGKKSKLSARQFLELPSAKQLEYLGDEELGDGITQALKDFLGTVSNTVFGKKNGISFTTSKFGTEKVRDKNLLVFKKLLLAERVEFLEEQLNSAESLGLSEEEISSIEKELTDSKVQFMVASDKIALDEKAAEAIIDILRDAGVDVRVIGQDEFNESEYFKLITKDGTVYGFADGDVIYLIKERFNANTPIHEYTHLWDRAYMKEHPKEWERLKELLKETEMWEAIANDPNYADIASNEDLLASEVHAQLTGAYGAARFNDMLLEARNSADTKKQSIVLKLKKWFNSFNRWLSKKFNADLAKKQELEEFIAKPILDIINKKDSNIEEKEVVSSDAPSGDNVDYTVGDFAEDVNRINDIKDNKEKAAKFIEALSKVQNRFINTWIDSNVKFGNLIKRLNEAGRKAGLAPMLLEQNAYEQASLSSSKENGYNAIFNSDYLAPLIDEYKKCIAKIADVYKLKGVDSKRKLELYLYAKDYLEREELGEYHGKKVAEWRENFEEESGFTPEDYIENIERILDHNSLWGAINNATQYLRDMLYENKLWGKRLYDEKNLRKFYVPQRDSEEFDIFKEDKAEEPVVKRKRKAKGVAPEASMRATGRASLAHSALEEIVRLARNTAKHASINHPKAIFLDMFKNEVYAKELEKAGIKLKVPFVYTDESLKGSIPTEEEIALYFELDNRIERLLRKPKTEYNDMLLNQLVEMRAAIGIAKSSRVNPKMLSPTEIAVKYGDSYYIIDMNDEQMANALNKTFIQDELELYNKIGSEVNRALSYVYTTANPEFAAKNVLRDYSFVLTASFVENPKLAKRILKNIKKPSMSALTSYLMTGHIEDSSDGKMLRQFIEDGGSSGYTTSSESRIDIKEDVDVALGFKQVKGGLLTAKKGVEYLSNMSEIMVRFNIYRSALELGESRSRAIHLSKNLNINFDIRGSRDTWASRFVFSNFLFSNAIVRAMVGGFRLLKVATKSKGNFARLSIAAPTLFALGYFSVMQVNNITDAIIEALSGDDDDDDEDGMRAYLNEELLKEVETQENAIKSYDNWGYETSLKVAVKDGDKFKLPIDQRLGLVTNLGANFAYYHLGQITFEDFMGKFFSSLAGAMMPFDIGKSNPLEATAIYEIVSLFTDNVIIGGKDKAAYLEPKYNTDELSVEVARGLFSAMYGEDPSMLSGDNTRPIEFKPEFFKQSTSLFIPSTYRKIGYSVLAPTLGMELNPKDLPLVNSFWEESERQATNNRYQIIRRVQDRVDKIDDSYRESGNLFDIGNIEQSEELYQKTFEDRENLLINSKYVKNVLESLNENDIRKEAIRNRMFVDDYKEKIGEKEVMEMEKRYNEIFYNELLPISVQMQKYEKDNPDDDYDYKNVLVR